MPEKEIVFGDRHHGLHNYPGLANVTTAALPPLHFHNTQVPSSGISSGIVATTPSAFAAFHHEPLPVDQRTHEGRYLWVPRVQSSAAAAAFHHATSPHGYAQYK